jgi:subfamily B ATP-binding cassette protein MsbA
MLEVLKKIYPYLKPFLKKAILAALFSIPLAAIKAYEAYFVKDVFDKGFSPDATFDQALNLAGILVGLAIINYPFRYFHFFWMRMVVDQATCLIRRDIYKKFQHLPASYFANAKQGNLLSVMINDTAIFAEAFMHALDIIREPLTAGLLLSVAFYHDWQLTMVIIIAAPLFMLIFNKTGKVIRKYVSLAQTDTADMTHHAAEGLIGQKIIKSFNLQKFILSRFEKSQDNFIFNKSKSNAAEEHSHPLVETVGALAFAGVIIFAHHRISSGELTTGGFVSFLAALAMFMDPVRKYSKANVKLNQARAAGERIFKILNLNEEVDSGKTELKDFQHDIEFRNITFSYGENTVLKNFSMKIHKGQKVGLVGLSGSGKSTLIALLLRLYPIEKGEILIDRVNINNYKLSTLREIFALVSQDVFLFNDTIIENLKVGNSYTEEQIKEALKVSYADEFVKDLPEKEMTMIGDRGMRLSGGQSQRITIARAFLKNCPVLLFDEATSALDNESEKIVQKALEKIAGHKTVIAVAHRLSTIQNYDNIVVMKDGVKVEEGSHETLMKNKNEYFKLYELSKE